MYVWHRWSRNVIPKVVNCTYLLVIDQNFCPLLVESRVIACWLFILVFTQLICWAFQGPLVSPSVQQVYLYLLCPRASLSSTLKTCENSLLSQWTSGYFSNHSLLFTQLVHWGTHSRSEEFPGGPMSPFFLRGLCFPFFLVGLCFLVVQGGPVINGFRCPLSLF